MKRRKLKQILADNPKLKWIPNALTLCNSWCGFAAILYTLRAYESRPNDLRIFATTALIILFAMIFDALDGFAARFFNAASAYGIQMDSLADMVTFGLAPAVTMAVLTHTLRTEMGRVQEIIVYGLCALYVGGAALRLAIYNVHAMLEKKSSDNFSGLPTPGAAAAVCSIFLLFYRENPLPIDKFALYLPVYAALLGFLMVSRLPYLHFGKWLFAAWRKPREFTIVIGMILFVIIFRTYGIFTLVTLYVFSGPATWLYMKIRNWRKIGKAA